MPEHALRPGELTQRDPIRMFIRAVPTMVEQARAVANSEARNHRGFIVGAAGHFYNESTHEVDILTGGNQKSRQRTKVCAERMVLSRAAKVGLTHATGLVVAATTELELIEGVTGVPTPTLHPCGECIGLLDEHGLVRGDTLFVTTGLDEDKYQVHTVGELTTAYKEEFTQGLMHNVRMGFEAWDERTRIYDHLFMAERTLPLESQRPAAELARMALLATDL